MYSHKDNFTRKEVLKMLNDALYVDWRKGEISGSGEQHTFSKIDFPDGIYDDLMRTALEKEKADALAKLDKEFSLPHSAFIQEYPE